MRADSVARSHTSPCRSYAVGTRRKSAHVAPTRLSAPRSATESSTSKRSIQLRFKCSPRPATSAHPGRGDAMRRAAGQCRDLQAMRARAKPPAECPWRPRLPRSGASLRVTSSVFYGVAVGEHRAARATQLALDFSRRRPNRAAPWWNGPSTYARVQVRAT